MKISPSLAVERSCFDLLLSALVLTCAHELLAGNHVARVSVRGLQLQHYHCRPLLSALSARSVVSGCRRCDRLALLASAWLTHTLARAVSNYQNDFFGLVRVGKEGAMKRSEDGRWAHAACAFYTPGVLIETRGVCGINKVGAFPRCAFANSATSVTARAVSVIACG